MAVEQYLSACKEINGLCKQKIRGFLQEEYPEFQNIKIKDIKIRPEVDDILAFSLLYLALQRKAKQGSSFTKLKVLEVGAGKSFADNSDFNSPGLSRLLATTFPDLFDISVADYTEKDEFEANKPNEDLLKQFLRERSANDWLGCFVLDPKIEKLFNLKLANNTGSANMAALPEDVGLSQFDIIFARHISSNRCMILNLIAKSVIQSLRPAGMIMLLGDGYGPLNSLSILPAEFRSPELKEFYSIFHATLIQNRCTLNPYFFNSALKDSRLRSPNSDFSISYPITD